MAFKSRSITMRLVLTVTFIGLSLTAHPEPSYACSCIEPSPSEMLAESDVVFIGRVVSVSEAGSLNSWDLFQTEFYVSAFWKGPVHQTMYIRSQAHGASCGYQFNKGVEYLVYAYYSDYADGLWTGLCSRNTPLSGAMIDLAALGEGKTPALGANDPASQATTTPTAQPTKTPLPHATSSPTTHPTFTPTPQATNTPTADSPETSGGCGLSPDKVDISFVGLLTGLAWVGLRKRTSG